MAFPRLVMSALKNFRRVLPLMRHERVPLGLKAGAVGMALLIISPVDIFSDIPVLGLFDDAVLLSLLAAGFVAIAGRMSQTLEPQSEPRNVTPGSLRMR